jgi:hypothetical protein
MCKDISLKYDILLNFKEIHNFKNFLKMENTIYWVIWRFSGDIFLLKTCTQMAKFRPILSYGVIIARNEDILLLCVLERPITFYTRARSGYKSINSNRAKTIMRLVGRVGP